MVKLDFDPKTLDDRVIRDGLCAVSALAGDRFSKGQYFVVGGIATQSYLPTSCRRGTCDIDLAVLMRLNKENFRRFSRNAREYLQDYGYLVGDRKSQGAFCLEYSNDSIGSSFIEFPRFSEKRFEEKRTALQRERANAKSKIIEGTSKTYIVSSPEDIIVPKLVRTVNSLKRNPLYEHYVSNMNTIDNGDIKERLKNISELRMDAMLNPGDLQRSEILRFVSDLYDMRMLSELGGINQAYFQESIMRWESLRQPGYLRDLVSRAALPEDLLPHDFTW